jgi:hypothetical protein
MTNMRFSWLLIPLSVLVFIGCPSFNQSNPLQPFCESRGSPKVQTDTVRVVSGQFGTYYSDVQATYLNADTTADCAWRGDYDVGTCGSLYQGLADLDEDWTFIGAGTVKFITQYTCRRGWILFDTRRSSVPDSCKVRVHLASARREDGDSLWLIQFAPHAQLGCLSSYTNLTDSCNFYTCGQPTFLIEPVDHYCVPTEAGWWDITLDPSMFHAGTFTCLGLVTRRTPGVAPAGVNYFFTETYAEGGSNLAQLISWYTVSVKPGERWGNRWGEEVW